MKIHTLGFTRKGAKEFFGLLKESGAKRLVDVRLNNRSQLAGFTKKDDLAWFLRELCGMDYIHRPDLAPTEELLGAYRKGALAWDAYEHGFMELMRSRRIEETVPRDLLDGACLLCSEETPEHCHRRLVVEYLREQWGDIEVVHLG